MNFEELQQNWRSQPIETPADVKKQVTDELGKQQRKLMWTNIAVTIAFILVLVDFAWVYITIHDGRTILFSASLALMTLLLLVYLWVLWRGLAYKKDDTTLSSISYIDYCLEKLRWRRKTHTTYIWIYSVILWLALMLYCIDVTRGGNMLFRIGAPLCCTIYIFGFQFIIKKWKGKKQLKKIDDLIASLQQLKESMSK